eukprot:GSA25T00021659001.1
MLLGSQRLQTAPRKRVVKLAAPPTSESRAAYVDHGALRAAQLAKAGSNVGIFGNKDEAAMANGSRGGPRPATAGAAPASRMRPRSASCHNSAAHFANQVAVGLGSSGVVNTGSVLQRVSHDVPTQFGDRNPVTYSPPIYGNALRRPLTAGAERANYAKVLQQSDLRGNSDWMQKLQRNFDFVPYDHEVADVLRHAQKCSRGLLVPLKEPIGAELEARQRETRSYVNTQQRRM